MIVHPLREARHAAARCAVGRQKAENAFGARHQQRRVETLLQIALQIAHFSLAALCQKSLETAAVLFNFFGLCSAKIQETVCGVIDFY